MSPEMSKALELTLKSIEKNHGKGSIMKLTDEVSVDPKNIVSTGSIGLNSALGIGGYRRGRIVEIYGPESSGKTTLTLHAIANAQKQGKVCAFIDAEHALDPVYASNLGVKLDELLVSQPDFGEQALNIVEMLAASGEVGLIVVDSVAALTPKKELEGDMGDSFIGLQARLMSQAMRKLTGAVNKTECIIIFINQIRMKIGVMFGCFSYDTLVNFVDGRSLPIGEVVDNQIQGDVYSLNVDTGKIESKPIIDWHDNGKVETKEDFIHIETESIDGKGRFGFTCTRNHKIFTEQGLKKAEDLSFQDKLISKYTNTINGTYGDFINGVLIGDSHISIRDKNTGCLKLQDNQNSEYINWKLDKLAKFINFREIKINRGYRYDSEFSYEWAKVKKELNQRDPMHMLNNYSNLGLALWIMDDGNLDLNNGHRRYGISIKRFKNNKEKLKEIQERLYILGFECNYRLKDGYVQFRTTITKLIASKIHKYIPECMQYKLPEEFRKQYKEFSLSNSTRLETDTVIIKEIRNASDRQMRNKRKFDISVKGNHNYMVGGKHNGIIVHNSPETTTGGGALKFYASQRLDIRRRAAIKEDDKIIGNRTEVKVVKNKLAPPFRTAEFDIRYGIGIDALSEIIDLGVEDDVINKAGSWYSYKEDKIGQGKKQAMTYLKENPNIKDEIEAELLDLRGISELIKKKGIDKVVKNIDKKIQN